MRTLLDEILEIKDHGKGCNCNTCSKTGHNHSRGCTCASCTSKIKQIIRTNNETPFNKFLLEEIEFESINQQYGIEDFTQQAKTADCSRQHKFNCKSGTRPLSQIDSIVLHQTAGSPSTYPSNSILAIPIHYVVLSNGRILQLYNDADYINHAGADVNKTTGKPNNTFNQWSVGIEFAGTFANDSGKCRWNSTTKYVDRGYSSGGRTCSEPTSAQIAAGRRLVTAIKEKIPSVEFIIAHRQGDAQRANDPGPTIWLQIAEWAKKNLDFSSSNLYTEFTGLPIPDSWRRGTILDINDNYGPGY